MSRWLILICVLLVGQIACTRTPLVDEPLTDGPFSVNRNKEQSFYLKVEPQWELVCEQLTDPLMLVVTHEDGRTDKKGVQPGQKLLWRFERAGLVEVRLGAALQTVAIHGLTLRRTQATTSKPTPHGTPVPEARPPVLIYMVDTLRQDRLGCYGDQRGLTPNIDDFAKEAVVYENLIAASSWTQPSVASIFTGLPQRTHQVYVIGHRLAEDFPTLAETLSARGYRTACVAANPFLNPEFGLDRGFQHIKVTPLGQSKVLHEQMFSWLQEGEKPFFAYLHTMEPHTPYWPPAEYNERFAPGVAPEKYFKLDERREIVYNMMTEGEAGPQHRDELRALYDAEVAASDANFGSFIQEMKRRGIYDSTLIVLLSDHGEEFLEHGGWQHGKTVYQEQIQVPLLVKYPSGYQAGTRVSEPVTHMDLFPTLLGTRLKLPSNVGVDLKTPELGRVQESSIFLEDTLYESFIIGPWKLIRSRNRNSTESRMALYNLEEDPGETTDLAPTKPIRAGYIDSMVKRWQASLAPTEELSPALKRQLRSLSYL